MTVNAGLRWDYLNNKVRRAGCAGRHVDWPAAFRRAERCAELQRSVAAARPRLRPVRQRQDGAQGDAEPLRADLDGRLRAAAQPAQHLGQQHDAAVDVRRQRRRHPAGLRARPAQQQRLRPGEHRHALRSGNDSRLRQPPQQLGSVGHRLARADVARRRGAVVFPARAGTLHDDRQPGRHARATSSSIASPRREIRGCPTAAATRSAASTTSRRRSSASPPATS